jgi:CHRD domain
MIKLVLTVTAVVFAVVLTLTQPVTAADGFGARLRGLEEVPSISSAGQGFFFGALNDAETALDYTVVYFGLDNVTQSHIHIGQTSVNGGIVLFFCTNLAPPAGVPAPPACPNGPVNTVTGTLTAANVVPATAQGIAAGEFSKVVRALKAGSAYANVHTGAFGGGEIRGQISR